jgi:hypothetical protein
MRRRFLLNRTEKPNIPNRSQNLPDPIPTSASPIASSESTIVRPKQTVPFVNVPSEILLYILKMAMVPGKKGIVFSRRQTPLPQAVCFSHISFYVRTTVLGDPSLWTTMDNSVLQSGAMTDAYLMRSQDSLIDIDMCGSYRHPVRIIRKLVTHIHRWRRLHLYVYEISPPDLGKVVECLRLPSAPNLLDLDVGNVDGTGALVIFTGGTPSLKSLHLMSNMFSLPKDLRALTRFSLYTIPEYMPTLTYAMFCTVLVAMPSLTHLQLIGEVAPWPPINAAKPIMLPALQSLHLDPSEDYEASITIEDYSVSSLFATFTTPSLQQLSLDYLTPEILTCFLECLQKGVFSFQQVTCLTWMTELGCEDVTTIVQSLPALEDFTLMDCHGDDFLKVLLDHDNEPSVRSPLWPCLRRLNFHTIEFSNLRDYISSRIRWQKPIKVVQLHDSLRPTKQDPHLKFLRGVVDLKFVPHEVLVTEGTGWSPGWQLSRLWYVV